MHRFAIFLLFVISLTGCYSVRVDSGSAARNIIEERQHFFGFGLVGDFTIDLKEMCPAGVASFGDKITFVDGAMSFASVGIYTPRTVFVECR